MLVLSEVCMQCPVRLSSVVPWFYAFLVCCPDLLFGCCRHRCCFCNELLGTVFLL